MGRRCHRLVQWECPIPQLRPMAQLLSLVALRYWEPSADSQHYCHRLQVRLPEPIPQQRCRPPSGWRRSPQPFLRHAPAAAINRISPAGTGHISAIALRHISAAGRCRQPSAARERRRRWRFGGRPAESNLRAVWEWMDHPPRRRKKLSWTMDQVQGQAWSFSGVFLEVEGAVLRGAYEPVPPWKTPSM